VLYAIVQTPLLLIAVSGMQMLTFPLYMIAQKVLIDDETPVHLKSSGQMLGMALFNGVPTFITPLLAGILVNSLGYDTTLMIFRHITGDSINTITWHIVRKLKIHKSGFEVHPIK
jgi:hypothetical protein